MWEKSIAAASRRHTRAQRGRDASAYDGFTLHMLRHTAGSLMALAGLDPAVACERPRHTDGGALFLKPYRRLYESEKRVQAQRLDALVHASVDKAWAGEAGAGQKTAQ